MKKKFDFDLGDDDDNDIDNDLNKQINKIELKDNTKVRDAYSSVVSQVKENPYTAHREIDDEPAHDETVGLRQISTTSPEKKQLSSA